MDIALAFQDVIHNASAGLTLWLFCALAGVAHQGVSVCQLADRVHPFPAAPSG